MSASNSHKLNQAILKKQELKQGGKSKQDDTLKLLREEKNKCLKLQLENDRLKKSIDILQRSLQVKSEEIENKNTIINKLLDKTSVTNNATLNVSDNQKSSCHKDVDDFDIDTLLKANLGDLESFDSILDISGSGNILPTDLPDVACDSFMEDNFSLAMTDLLKPDPMDIPNINQVPNREVTSGDMTTVPGHYKDDQTIITRLVDQQRNYAHVQRKVSPLKIILDKKKEQLVKRPAAPGSQPPVKKIKMDNSSLYCPHCSKQFPLGGSWKLQKHIKNQHSNDVDPVIDRKVGDHRCYECDKVFSSISALTSHKQKHKTKFPWNCNMCKNEFSQMECLVEHLKIEHNITKINEALTVVNWN